MKDGTYNITYYENPDDVIAKGFNIEANGIADAVEKCIKAKPGIQIVSVVNLYLLSGKKILVANEYFKNQIYKEDA